MSSLIEGLMRSFASKLLTIGEAVMRFLGFHSEHERRRRKESLGPPHQLAELHEAI